MTQDISFSVIIPSFNRKKYLMDTLRCLEAQTVLPAEVIVVDASLSDYRLTRDDVDSFALPLKYIEWDEIGNICKQRNHAIEIAKSKYILFLDDDVQFESDLIANYIEAFLETGADGISGNVATPKRPHGSPPLRHTGFLNEMGEMNIQTCDFVAETRIICTASFAVRKKSLEQIGGFDLNQRGTLDDVEVGFRLTEAGCVIIHHPLPKVLHFQAPMSGARDTSQGASWSVENRVYFQLKHRYRSDMFFLSRMVTSFLRPSREWLNPKKRVTEYTLIFTAFLRSRTLLTEGGKA